MSVDNLIILSQYNPSKPQVIKRYEVNEKISETYGISMDEIVDTIIEVAERTNYSESEISNIIRIINEETIPSGNYTSSDISSNGSEKSAGIYRQTNRDSEYKRNGRKVFQRNGKTNSNNDLELDNSSFLLITNAAIINPTNTSNIIYIK